MVYRIVTSVSMLHWTTVLQTRLTKVRIGIIVIQRETALRK